MNLLAQILQNLRSSIILGGALALALIAWLHGDRLTHFDYWGPFFTWLHVVSGITWVGLLYYLNLVQMPLISEIPPSLKPAVGKFIAPRVLLWFRWSAIATMATGLIVAALNGYLLEALSFAPAHRTIGTGMWLGLVMAFNVWFIIWPNQKRVLGIVPADDAEKAKSTRVAMLTSRMNFVLSFPMLYCMVAYRLLG